MMGNTQMYNNRQHVFNRNIITDAYHDAHACIHTCTAYRCMNMPTHTHTHTHSETHCSITGGNIPLLLVDSMNCMHRHVLYAIVTKNQWLIGFNSKIPPLCTHSDPILYCFHKNKNAIYISD